MNKVQMFLKRHASTFLTLGATAGFVGTVYYSNKATLKAKDIVDRKRETLKEGEELDNVEVVKEVIPNYILPIVLGVGTIVCIFSANALNKKQQAMLTSAYAILEQSYKQYKNAAKEIKVVESDDESAPSCDDLIEKHIAEKKYIHADGKMVYNPDNDFESPDTLFYDLYSRRYFTSTIPAVLNAFYHINRNLTLGATVTVNDYYDFLGIDGVPNGDKYVWDHRLYESGLGWLDFNTEEFFEIEDGVKARVIVFDYNPEIDFDLCDF